MSRLLLLMIVALGLNARAQEGFQLGVEVSPAWNINIQKQKATGLRSYDAGYGFNIGVPIKWWFSESMALQTGVSFDYMAFDDRFQNTLTYSLRFGSINVPLMLNYKLGGSWFAIFGAGTNINLLNQVWSGGITVDISNTVNTIQPYAGAGVGTIIERDKGAFELGVQARYHFLNLYSKGTTNTNQFRNSILSFDFLIRMYLFNR